jgi:hypothetical protein
MESEDPRRRRALRAAKTRPPQQGGAGSRVERHGPAHALLAAALLLLGASLSAHHCFHDQRRAYSLEPRWGLFSGTCGGPIGPRTPLPGGADILHLHKSTDTALLRLRRPAPTGTPAMRIAHHLPAPNAPVVSLHHPDGGAQQIANRSPKAKQPPLTPSARPDS